MENSQLDEIQSQISNLQTLFKEIKKTIQASESGFPEDLLNQGITRDSIVDDFPFLIKNLQTLLKTQSVFTIFTTYEERKELIKKLEVLYNSLSNKDYAEIGEILDYLRKFLRAFRTFTTKNYIRDYYIETNNLIAQQEKLQAQKDNTEDIIQEIQQQKNSVLDIIQDVNKEREALEENIKKTEISYNSLLDEIRILNEKNEEINNAVTTSKSKEELIKNISINVERINQQLTEQDTKFQEYDKRLADYKEEQTTRMEEADLLIKKAKDALKYNTVHGLSGAMAQQYTESKGFSQTWLWIIFATIGTVATGVLGWLLFINDQDYSLQQFFARSLLLFTAGAATTFSIKQYTKQKNIIEDYAYKQVLAKSLIGLSEEYAKAKSSNDIYLQFMTKMQEEMLQHPLREHNLKVDKIDDIAEKVIDKIPSIKTQN